MAAEIALHLSNSHGKATTREDLVRVASTAQAHSGNKLSRQGQDDIGAKLTKPQPILAIESLPSELADLVPGMLYAIIADTQAIRLALAAQSLSASAHASAPSVLVTGHDPHALVKKAKSFSPSLEKQLTKGSARILRLDADISRRLLRFGSAKLVEDLKAQDIAQHSLLIIDQASKVLGLSDPATAAITAQIFQSWAEQSKLAILFLIQSDKENPREYASLKTVAEHWAGLAVVKSSSNRTSMTFKHWFGIQGITAGGRFLMGLSSSGQLGVSLRTKEQSLSESSSTTISPTQEEHGLIATTLSLTDLGDLGPLVQSCDDPLELMDLARRARGGTVLLHFSQRNELARLGKLVANLRSITSPEVRILIRECGAKLRKTESYSLLQLGASFIVPKDVSPESAKILIEQLGSAALRRLHNPRAAEQLRQLLEESTGQLLTAYDFRLRVTNLLDLSDARLPHTLVILKTPLKGLSRRIASLIGPRIRDVMFTESDGRLLLFLFGCSTEAAEIVMSRLFVTAKEPAASWKCTSDADIIRRLLVKIDTPSANSELEANTSAVRPSSTDAASSVNTNALRERRNASA
jgi:Cellulose biosynthesis GIL